MHTVENPGEGEAQTYAKIPGVGWGQGFLRKISRENTILGFIAFLLVSFQKIAKGAFFHPSITSHL